MTSISRLREKIESRIVFAIRSADEIRSTIVASRNAVESTRATVSTRSETAPPSLIFSTPGGTVGARRLRAIAFAFSPSTGVTSNASGSGLPGRFSTISGCSLRIRSSASAFETHVTSLTSGSAFSFARTALIWAGFASCLQVESVQK